MPDFYPVNTTDETIIRGPGRLMTANPSVAFPIQINDVVNVSSYAASAGWSDLGATKGGIQMVFNNSEEAIDVDQINGDLDVFPTGVEASVQTQLAEATLDRLVLAWEGSPVTTSAVVGGNEKKASFGTFTNYTRRRMAIGFRRSSTGKLRVAAYRRVQRGAQESTITFNKEGEQQTIPVRFRALPDTSVAEERERLFTIFDQV